MFKIIWSDDAIRQFEVMLRIGSKFNRRGITRAVQEIEIALRDAPDEVGESRPGGRRISYCSPLAYYFALMCD